MDVFSPADDASTSQLAGSGGTGGADEAVSRDKPFSAGDPRLIIQDVRVMPWRGPTVPLPPTL